MLMAPHARHGLMWVQAQVRGLRTGDTSPWMAYMDLVERVVLPNEKYYTLSFLRRMASVEAKTKCVVL